MTSPAVTLSPDVRLPDLAATLETHAISAVPIVRDGHLVGIVSTTDLVADENAAQDHAKRASDLMRAPVFVVGPDDPVEEAARRMSRERVHRLVVVEKDRPIGVVSARDILVEVKSAHIATPIGDMMTSDLVTVEMGDTIEEAVARLAVARIHGLVVLDGTKPVGVFTHAEALAARKLPPELRKSPVEEVMSYETICLDQKTPVYRAAGHAIATNIRRILVVHDHYLVGVLSCLDLLGALAH